MPSFGPAAALHLPSVKAMADGSSSAAELEKAQGMKRSTSLQSNLSSHTHSSSSSTQRFDSSSDSLALADWDFSQSEAHLRGVVSGTRLPLAPMTYVPEAGDSSPDASEPSVSPTLLPKVPLTIDLLKEDSILGKGSTGAVRLSSCGRIAWKLMTPAGASFSDMPTDAQPSTELLHPHLVVSHRTPSPHCCRPF